MAKHATYSPSSSKRWMTCPGSIVLSEGRENKSSAYADEGTAAHFVAACCLQNNVTASCYVGQQVLLLARKSDGEHTEFFASDVSANISDAHTVLSTFTVDDDMAEAVQVYVDYARDLATSSGGVLFAEVQVPLDHLTGEEGATGTSDIIVVAAEEIIVADLKFGRGVEVSAIENTQMLMYASGALRYIEDLVGGTEKIKTVRIAISQPRISKLPSEWSCTVEELRVFEEEVRQASAVCKEAKVDFHDTKNVIFADWEAKYLQASDEGCRFCRVKPCSTMDSAVVEVMGVAGFDDLDAVPEVHTEPPDNDLLSKRMKAVDLVELWCKAVRAEAESQLLQGNVVPGYKLVKGKMGNRSWLDDAKAERLLKKLKLKRDQMYEVKLISPTTAEKVIGKASETWPVVQELITQKEGGLSVAPESDRRPAVEVKPPTDGFFPLTE